MPAFSSRKKSKCRCILIDLNFRIRLMFKMCSSLVLFIAVAVAILTLLPAYGDIGHCEDKDDFRYEYTPCDYEGKRWRVAVPKSDECIGFPPPLPVKGKMCNFTCEPGHYLEMNDQECKPCPNGTFSLGGGIRFDDWQEMPPSFSVEVENFSFEKMFNIHLKEPKTDPEGNCSGGWVPSGKYLLAKYSDCPILLVYEVDSVRDGAVTFTYENSDNNLLFTFEVENQKCELRKNRKEEGNLRHLVQTEEGEFKKFSVVLPPGHNRLVWTVMSLSLADIVEDKKVLKKFAKIEMIEVKGVAFTSECTPCRAGTYSGRGEHDCHVCPENTFSNRRSHICSPCDINKEYSDPGSKSCSPRPPCTPNDYLEIIQPCESNEKIMTTYKWNDRSVCDQHHNESVKLPSNGQLTECPPCNPGMQLVNKTCSFCPPEEFSRGNKGEECKKCPSSTAPVTGIFINHWNVLNFSQVNLSSQCISSFGLHSDCRSKIGWLPDKDHIHTIDGNDPMSYLLLSMRLSGFKLSNKRVSLFTESEDYNGGDDNDDEDDGGLFSKRNYESNTNVATLAYVTFEFEVKCSEQCSLFFIRKTNNGPLHIIETWSGDTPRTKYSFPVNSPHPVTFSWTFQQKPFDIMPSPLQRNVSSHSFIGNYILSNLKEIVGVARIFSINITNTLVGGASGCAPCPQGATRDGCIPCPVGHYVDPENKSCVSCSGNTVVSDGLAWGAKSCTECGEGLLHYNHELCVTDCIYHSSHSNDTYNFSSLAGPKTIEGPRLFTTSGYRYFNIFNISLCSDRRKISQYPLANCVSNYTTRDSKEDQTLDEVDHVGFIVPVCRSTALPSDKGPTMLTNPLSFGDTLEYITDRPNANITKLVRDANLYDPSKNVSDVYFVYKSDTVTRACKSGRLSVIVLRCDLAGPDDLELPPKCPDGTCDGCNFVFLWKASVACPVCKHEDYKNYSGECKNGTQSVIRSYTRQCYTPPGFEVKQEVACSNFWFIGSPLWVKIAVVLIPVFFVAGLISMFVVIYCWSKNRKLQYKYMKLIESSTHSKDGMELPGVDSCGIDEGDEEEQFDAVEFKSSSKKNNFFSKLAGQASSRKGPGFFEKVDKDEKMSLT